MKKILFIFTVCLCVACGKLESEIRKDVDNDFVRNFEKFRQLVDENYCFLGTKYDNDKTQDPINLDWNKVCDAWMDKVKDPDLTEVEFFNILGKCLNELRDGHIWLDSDFKHYSNNEYKLLPDGSGYYSDIHESGRVQKYYLHKGGDYDKDKSFVTKNGIVYGMIERDGKKFMYIYHGKFTEMIGQDDLKNYIGPMVNDAHAIIYDVRDNPGGSGQYGIVTAGYFMKEATLVGYNATKSGPGYDDFTEPTEIICNPSTEFNWSDKPTALLTNRGVYSTANLFTNAMRYAPNVIQVGQISGGGGGLPNTHHLPNGWLLVFASNILLDKDMKHIEPGIAPKYEATLGTDPTKDGVLETAIEKLKSDFNL